MREASLQIRPPVEAELPRLQEIERSAGTPFAEIGMDRIASDDPPALDELRQHLAAGNAWVAVITEPVAYLLAQEVDGALHIEQVSVHAEHFRKGIGRVLLDHAAAVARARGLPALTLTTYVEVPWNAPYYQRLGFRTLSESELTPGLVEIRASEAELGLDEWPRCCMRRDLPRLA